MDGFEVSIQKVYDTDPNRIESVSILKDAAATAMYGSRAANGVVVITTVAPKPGRLMVSYSMAGNLTFPDLSDYNLANAEENWKSNVFPDYMNLNVMPAAFTMPCGTIMNACN